MNNQQKTAGRSDQLVLVGNIAAMGSYRFSYSSANHSTPNSHVCKHQGHMKKVMLIIDPQYDFIWGSLPVPEAASAINSIVVTLAFKTESFDSIVVTADMHPDNHCSFKENGGIWPAHCVRHTLGCSLHSNLMSVVNILYKDKLLVLDKGLAADHEEYSILKNQVSKDRLLPVLQDADEIHICGLAGNFCVLDTIKDLVALGFGDKVIVRRNLSPQQILEMLLKLLS